MPNRTLSMRLTAVVLSASLVWLSAGIEPGRVRAEEFVEATAPGRAEFAASPALVASVQASLGTLEPSAAAGTGAGMAALVAALKRSADAPEGAAAARLISEQLARDPATLQSFSAAAPAERQAIILSALSTLASSSGAAPAAAAPPSEGAAIAQTVAETVRPWRETVLSGDSDAVREPREVGQQQPTPPPSARTESAASAAPVPAVPGTRTDNGKRLIRVASLATLFIGASAFALPDGYNAPVAPSAALWAGLAGGLVLLMAGGLYGLLHWMWNSDARQLARLNATTPTPAPDASDAQAASMAPAPRSPQPQEPARDIEKQAMLEDVAGQTQAKEEIDSLVDYLKNPQAYKDVGAQGYKGVLLFGPPGTGKTLLARAIANEAGIPIVTRKGSEFIRVYVGKGAENMEAAFKEARQKAIDNNSAAILYIDEIDAVGGTRADNGEGGGREHAQTLNQLLSEMDGFEKDVDHPIIMMASTNRPDMLDPALLRGGRFELQVPVGLPDAEGRLAVLKVHTRNKPLAEDADLREIAQLTPGLAGADLKAIVNDAAMLAGRRRAKQITRADLLRAVERKTDGHERRLVMSEQERRVVSYHEGGHALVSHLLPDADPVTKITIVPHGLNALGYMKAMGEEDRNVMSQAWLRDRMAVAMGGRAGEELMTGRKYSGAQNDLEQATRIARAMVMKFGMSDKVGHVSYDNEGERPMVGRPLSEASKEVIEAEVKKLLEEALDRARSVLKANKDVLERLAAELREKETLRGEDLERLIGRDGKRR